VERDDALADGVLARASALTYLTSEPAVFS
jgi:hypothetical protein